MIRDSGEGGGKEWKEFIMKFFIRNRARTRNALQETSL